MSMSGEWSGQAHLDGSSEKHQQQPRCLEPQHSMKTWIVTIWAMPLDISFDVKINCSRLFMFDFDQTLSVVHVFKSLAGWPRQQVTWPESEQPLWAEKLDKKRSVIWKNQHRLNVYGFLNTYSWCVVFPFFGVGWSGWSLPWCVKWSILFWGHQHFIHPQALRQQRVGPGPIFFDGKSGKERKKGDL